MTVKKKYSVGDSVWIYGVSSNNKLTKGKIIKEVDLSELGYSEGIHYIIEIPTHIEPLLEIRSWENISQDEKGPVGALRSIGEINPTLKKAKTIGFTYSDDIEDDGPSDEEIHAALEKSQKHIIHQPLILKETKPIRKSFRKKKQ